MKKSIFFIVLFTFTAIVNAAETVTVSGKISNSSDGKIAIRGESFEKTITLQPDGSFSEVFTIDYNGSYFIATSKNRATIYLAKGTKLVINGDDSLLTLKFSGKGATENQYIAEKSKILMSVANEALFKSNETEFIQKTKDILASLQTLYGKTKFESPEFKIRESRNLTYIEQLYLINYPTYHAHYAKDEAFKASEAFPKVDSTINLDNEEEYLFSNTYKQLVNATFNQTIEKKVTTEDQFLSKLALPEIKKYKSQSIKNGLAAALSYEINASNPDAENLFQELMALSTDEMFKNELKQKFNKIKKLSAGKLSPQFEYENHKGGKTSLSSLKGKYVYIDVWATWCGPCRQEIPSLQKVEAQYHGKNIEFVSMSIDAKKDYDKWKSMVTDKKLGGIQVIADSDWNSEFVKDYAIDGIPRFILVAPDGTIVNADAPRPSEERLITLFNDLKI